MMLPAGNCEVNMLPIAHMACKMAGRGKPGSDGWRFREVKKDGAWNIRDAWIQWEKNAWMLYQWSVETIARGDWILTDV